MSETKPKPNFQKKKKDYSKLLKNKYVLRWVENYRADLQRPRLSILIDFMEFTKKTPEQLILEHAEDIRQPDTMDIKDITKIKLKEYYQHLMAKGNSKNTAIQKVYSKLAGFWKRNKIPINWEDGDIPIMNQNGVKDKVMRDDDGVRIKDKKSKFKMIRDTLKNTRDKALLLCKLSSGIDDVDLFELKIKDFKLGIYPDFNVCYIHGNRIKPKGNPVYQAILNSEACDLIDIYLLERKGYDVNDYLFINYSDKSKIGATVFADNIRKVCKLLGIKNVTPKYFRNWTNTVLKKEIPAEVVERMLGHKKPISEKYQQIFNDTSGEELVEEFANKINEITCLGNGNHKMQYLKDDINELKDHIVEKDLKISEMEKDIVNVNITLVKVDEKIKSLENTIKTLMPFAINGLGEKLLKESDASEEEEIGVEELLEEAEKSS